MNHPSFRHTFRLASGAPVATLRCVSSAGAMRLEWLGAAQEPVLLAQVGGPGATRLLDAAGRDIPCADPWGPAPPAEPSVRSIGSGGVMRSCEVAGHPAWIIDDYGNRTRHFVFGCTPERFLHVHLDAHGNTTMMEKTREHATLRTIRRDANGVLLADEAFVQPGEALEDIARRSGVTLDALRAANMNLPVSPPAGTLVRLA